MTTVYIVINLWRWCRKWFMLHQNIGSHAEVNMFPTGLESTIMLPGFQACCDKQTLQSDVSIDGSWLMVDSLNAFRT